MSAELISTIALTMGAAWASGINLYATLLVLGGMGATGNIDLPPDLQVLQDPTVLFAAGAMYMVEFFADKVPGVDTAWDTLHTFIRIPAGAMVASAAIGDVTPALELSAAILGGSLTAVTHATKAGSRVLINTSPEPVSNWAASIAEDVAVVGGLWVAMNHPVLFLVFLVVLLIFLAWALPKLWRAIRGLMHRIAGWFRKKPPSDDEPAINTSVTELPPDTASPPTEAPPKTGTGDGVSH